MKAKDAVPGARLVIGIGARIREYGSYGLNGRDIVEVVRVLTEASPVCAVLNEGKYSRWYVVRNCTEGVLVRIVNSSEYGNSEIRPLYPVDGPMVQPGSPTPVKNWEEFADKEYAVVTPAALRNAQLVSTVEEWAVQEKKRYDYHEKIRLERQTARDRMGEKLSELQACCTTLGLHGTFSSDTDSVSIELTGDRVDWWINTLNGLKLLVSR